MIAHETVHYVLKALDESSEGIDTWHLFLIKATEEVLRNHPEWRRVSRHQIEYPEIGLVARLRKVNENRVRAVTEVVLRETQKVSGVSKEELGIVERLLSLLHVYHWLGYTHRKIVGHLLIAVRAYCSRGWLKNSHR